VETLCGLFCELGNSLDMQETAATLDRELSRLMVFRALSIHLVRAGALEPAAVFGAGWQAVAAAVLAADIPGAEPLLARVARLRKPVLNQLLSSECLRMVAALPIEHAGQPVAVLTVYRGEPQPFSKRELGLLAGLAPKLGAALANAAAYGRVARLAMLDPATGRPNARALFERLDSELARAERAGGRLTVLHCAVEGLESFGELAGTEAAAALLERVASACREACREYDFVAPSGEDLVMVLANCGPQAVEALRTRLGSVVAEAGLRGGFPLAARLGVAHYPADGRDAEDLLVRADERVHAGQPAGH
jgi:diguanylate cyclase (GGDEF)-like protein